MSDMEIINKLFLELSEVATAETWDEADLRKKVVRLQDEVRELRALKGDPAALNRNITELRNKNLRLTRALHKNTVEHAREIAVLNEQHAVDLKSLKTPVNLEREVLEVIHEAAERVLGWEGRRG